jgi:hypothetical protein
MSNKKRPILPPDPALSIKSIVCNEANKIIKYWTGLTVDPKSKKFTKDYTELSNVILSVGSVIGDSRNSSKIIKSISNELARKTITGLIFELQSYKQKYLEEIEFIEKWKNINLETNIKDIPDDSDSSVYSDSDDDNDDDNDGGRDRDNYSERDNDTYHERDGQLVKYTTDNDTDSDKTITGP